MRAHPQLIGGSARPVTQLAAAVPGLVAKEGAEAVWAAALPDGRAFAAKLADGSPRGLGPLLATVLRYWGFDAPAIAYWAEAPVLGGGVPVGAIVAAAPLRDALGG
jgi:L-asparaginase II